MPIDQEVKAPGSEERAPVTTGIESQGLSTASVEKHPEAASVTRKPDAPLVTKKPSAV